MSRASEARAVFVFALLLAQASRAGQYLPVANGRLYYEECGSVRRSFSLHDGLLHSVVWDGMFPALCGKYHVVRYDRRGYGRSDAAKAPFSPEQDLLQLMDHASIGRAVLAASSSGSALALDFAIAHPDRVEALFLIGPVVHGMRSSDYFLQRGNAANADDIKVRNRELVERPVPGQRRT